MDTKNIIKNKPEQYYKLWRATKFAVFTPLILWSLGVIGLFIGGPLNIDHPNYFVVFLITIGGGGAQLAALVALAIVIVSIRAAAYNLIYFFWWFALFFSSLFFLTGFAQHFLSHLFL